MRNLVLGLAALAAFTSSAQAATIINDTFDGENGGNTALGYTAFSNFAVDGAVDLIKSGEWDITCSGLCVDLAGTPGPGALMSTTYTYVAGDIVNFSAIVGGSQRIANGSDDFYVDIVDGVSNAVIASNSWTLASTDPFATLSGGYTFTGNGTFYLKFGTTSTDNIGPLLDGVTADFTGAVPEPSTWAMMIGGFALVGSAMRRRKVNVQFA